MTSMVGWGLEGYKLQVHPPPTRSMIPLLLIIFLTITYVVGMEHWVQATRFTPYTVLTTDTRSTLAFFMIKTRIRTLHSCGTVARDIFTAVWLLLWLLLEKSSQLRDCCYRVYQKDINDKYYWKKIIFIIVLLVGNSSGRWQNLAKLFLVLHKFFLQGKINLSSF